MTHTLHRGREPGSLPGDIVILAMIDPAVKAQKVYGLPQERIQELISILSRHDPLAVSIRTPEKRFRYLQGWESDLDSGAHHGIALDQVAQCDQMEGVAHAVYTHLGSVEKVLAELKDAELGFSIVVSGIFDRVFEVCKRLGLEPHTVNMSLGVWGKTDLLPRDEISKLQTLCGHALVSPRLVEVMVEQLREGTRTPEEAAIELAKQCTCNVFNTARAVPLLRALAQEEASGNLHPLPQRIVERLTARTGSFVAFDKDEIEQSIPQRFEQQVRRTPDRIAVKARGRVLTYDALNRAANRLARGILARCGTGNEPLALLFEHEPAMIVGILGALKAGKIYVPLDPTYPQARLAYMLEDSQAAQVVTDSQHLPLVKELTGQAAHPISLDELSTDLTDSNLDQPLGPDTLAYILYTSGSTGQPKGIVNNHRNLLHQVMTYTNSIRLSRDDRHSQLQSSSFSRTLKEVFGCLLNGATLCMYDLREQGLLPLAGWLTDNEITVFGSAVTTFRHFVATLTGVERFPNLRLLYVGAEPLYRRDVELYQQHFDPLSVLVHGIGATETGTFLRFFMDQETKISGSLVPVGHPVQDMAVRLLDAKGNLACPDREGEITVQSRHLSRGYWRRPELTKAVFKVQQNNSDEQPVYYTGDLGRMGHDGCVELLGRKDLQVKVHGHRIEVAEIEMTLLAHPQIREAAVMAREERAGELVLVAYVVSRGGPAPRNHELRTWLGSNLPAYMIPAVYVVLEALPLTPSGKLDRRALPHPPGAQQESEVGFVPPHTPTEETLAAWWAELFSAEQVSSDASFFDLGGHSLLVLRLFGQIEQEFGRRLSPALIFQASTVEQLARIIDHNCDSPGWSSLVPIQPDGSQPPFFCVHGVGGGVLGYAELARMLGPDQPFYGLQAQGLDDQDEPHTSIEDMAAHYVAAMRSAQPDGPYCLGGYCYGGVVAYEMARQLQAQGKAVQLLAIFEGYALSRAEGRTHLRHPQGLLRFLGNLPFWLRDTLQRPGASRRLLARLRVAGDANPPEEIREWERGVAPLAIKGTVGVVDDLPQHLNRVLIAHLRAMQTYQPDVYGGRVTLFRVRTLSLFRAHDPKMGWGQLAEGGVVVKMIPGAHYNILEQPHVEGLAMALKASLDQA